MNEEIALAAGDIAYWKQYAETAEIKAQILTAQLGGWEAACAAQLAVLGDVLSYLHGVPYNVDTLKHRIEEATETNVGEFLLRELLAARALAATIHDWMAHEVSTSAVRVALAKYEAAAKARPQ